MALTPRRHVQTPDVVPVASADLGLAQAGPRRGVGWPDRLAVALLLAEATVLLLLARAAIGLPFWYNEQWRAWHISRSITGEVWRQLPFSDSPIAAGWLLLEKLATLAFGEVEAVYRWPVALCLPLLALTLYALGRRWLGPLASFLTAALVVANPLLYDFVWQLAPYTCEAMLAPLALLLWLKAADWEHRPALRLAAYVGVGVCAVVGTAITFVVAPLLAIDLARFLRTRAWRPFVPALLAGLIVVGHLAIFVLPQSEGSVAEFWVRWYAPRSPAAAGFAAHHVGAFVLHVVPGPMATDRVLGLLFWIALATGGLVAARDRRVRPLLVALAGALGLQLVASSIRLWAFGALRINHFLIPLVYLLAAVGAGRLVQLLARWSRSELPAAARRAAVAGSAVLLGVGVAGLLVAGALNTAGVRELRRQSLSGNPFDGIRGLVLAARPYAGTRDAVVFTQDPVYRNFKGWAYYAGTYGGWPPGVARPAGPPPARSLQVERHDPDRVRRFLAAHADAGHVLSVTMANADPGTVESVVLALRAAGLRPTRQVEAPRTGTLTIWTPAPPR
jgi:hypothetical protein